MRESAETPARRLAALFLLEGYEVREATVEGDEETSWTIWERGLGTALGSVYEGRSLSKTWVSFSARTKDLDVVRSWVSVELLDDASARLSRRALALRQAS